MQYSDRVLMIEPVNFGFNAETAVNNSFQRDPQKDIQQQALDEFNGLVNTLRSNKVSVTVIKDSPDPFTPDSIFPNNWISFHEDGTLFIYPMFATNRRKEKKEHVLEELRSKFVIKSINDLSHYEAAGFALEGTGSMVLDRDNRIAYACLSQRTNMEVLNEFCRVNQFSPLNFHATDINGDEIYHTNVMMCVGDSFALVCLDSIRDEEEKAKLIVSMHKTNKEIIEISLGQLQRFAGNMLQVSNDDKESLLVMSTQAYESLSNIQLLRLGRYCRLIHAPLDTIEHAGGGSARCMIAEIFNEWK